MSVTSASTARPHVTAVIVAHEGARWIPQLVSSLEASSRFPDQLVAVDTGSTDASPDLLRAALGRDAVLGAGPDTGFGAAVRLGLESLNACEPPPGTGWVWLIHDDCAPAPDALERLLATAALDDRIAAVGCRVRAWPRGRRLLEVGTTVAGTGRRVTGLEPGEYDQGQHDEVRDVLAVSSAGMLVRRDVWDRLGGLDRRLPLFRDDADFGWRVARAGHRVVVAPDALIFHVEAASRGVRPIDNTAQRPHQADRQAALYTLLVNCSVLALPFQFVRLVLGTVLRSLGFVLGKLPSAALDEVRALGHVVLRPDAVIAARMARRRTAQVPARRVRRLLPPWWSPYTGGAESLREAAADRVRTRAARSAPLSARWRIGRRDAATLETGPVPDETLGMPVGVSPWVWVLSHPLLSMLVALVLGSFVAARGLWGAGLLQGGALLPAPDSVGAWWQLYLESWHPVQLGSTEAASPYVALLGVLGVLLLGHAWLVVDLLLLFAVPLAAWGAFAASGRFVDGLAVRIWMSLAFAVLPVVSGAVTAGRLGTVVALTMLPWLVRAGYRLHDEPSWRAVFAAALLLSIVVAFAPVAWLLVAVVVLPWALWALGAGRRRLALRAVTAVALPALLLIPWSWRLLTTPALFLTEAGVTRAEDGAASWHVLFGRVDAPGQAPLWLTAGVMIGALAALFRADRRRAVAAAWVVIAGCLAVAAVLAGRDVAIPGTVDETVAWVGVPVTWAQAAAIVAAGLGADRLTTVIRSGSFSWRQPLAGLLAVLALAAPVAGLVWWVATAPQGDLTRGPVDALPAYMTDAMEGDAQQKVLGVTGDADQASYQLEVDDGLRLGEDSVLPADPDDELTSLVRSLLSTGGQTDVSGLADLGIEYVVLPQPADPSFVAALDNTVGLSRASTTARKLVGWQLDASVGQVRLLEPSDLDPEGDAGVLPSSRGLVDVGIDASQSDRVLLVATTSAGFVATLDGAELAAADRDDLGRSFAVGQTAGRLELEHQSDRDVLLILQLVIVGAAVLLATPSLSRPPGPGEPRP